MEGLVIKILAVLTKNCTTVSSCLKAIDKKVKDLQCPLERHSAESVPLAICFRLLDEQSISNVYHNNKLL